MPMHLSIRSAPKLRPHSSGPRAETEPDLRQAQPVQPSNLHLRPGSILHSILLPRLSIEKATSYGVNFLVERLGSSIRMGWVLCRASITHSIHLRALQLRASKACNPRPTQGAFPSMDPKKSARYEVPASFSMILNCSLV